eukprot:465634-Pleurochrysis_carterae.AAC.1
MSTSTPACLRKAAMPSGRWKESENRRRTVLEEVAGLIESGMCRDDGSELGASLAPCGACGTPGGWSRPVSATAVATGTVDDVCPCFQGNVFSSNETAAEIHADPSSGLDARLRVCLTRLYGESATAEGQDGHDAWLYTGQAFV